MIRAWAAAAILALLATAGAAAPANPPPWLAEAVALGSTKIKLDVYRAEGLAIEYTTPFLRVARAANKIVGEGRMPTGADIEAKAWVPELRVLVRVLPITEASRPAALATPKSARLTVGAGEVKATRMETGMEKQTVTVGGAAPETVNAGVLKAIFEVRGTPPAGAELEVLYVVSRDGRDHEIVRRVALDFRKTRW